MEIKKMIMLVLVVIIFISFFLPWISVESAAIGGVTKLLTGKEQSVFTQVSGFQVPVLANSDESRFMITIIKLFQPNVKDADKKSYLIWGVPLLAVVLFLLSYFLKDNKWVALAIGIIGIAIFAGAVFKISTTNLDKLVMQVKIAYGLWLILAGYLGLGILGILDFVKMLKK